MASLFSEPPRANTPQRDARNNSTPRLRFLSPDAWLATLHRKPSGDRGLPLFRYRNRQLVFERACVFCTAQFRLHGTRVPRSSQGQLTAAAQSTRAGWVRPQTLKKSGVRVRECARIRLSVTISWLAPWHVPGRPHCQILPGLCPVARHR